MKYSSNYHLRTSALKAKGIRQLPRPHIYRGFNDTRNNRQPVLIFDSQSAAESYTRHFRVAGRNERMWDHMGWFTDREFQDETYKPCIALMGKTGLYGYVEGCSGSVVFYLDGGRHNGEDLGDFQRDLARWADSVAQSQAEKECNFREKWRAGQKIADEIEEKEKERAAVFDEARDFIADLRRAAAGVCKDSAVWRHIVKMRKLAASLAATIADKTEQLKLYPEYE